MSTLYLLSIPRSRQRRYLSTYRNPSVMWRDLKPIQSRVYSVLDEVEETSTNPRLYILSPNFFKFTFLQKNKAYLQDLPMVRSRKLFLIKDKRPLTRTNLYRHTFVRDLVSWSRRVTQTENHPAFFEHFMSTPKNPPQTGEVPWTTSASSLRSYGTFMVTSRM